MSVVEQVRSTIANVFSNKKLLIFLVLAAIFIVAAIWVYNNYVKPRVEAAYVPNKEFVQKSDEGGGSHADLYFFHTTWCPHCKKALPIWIDFQAKNSSVNGVIINYHTVDCDNEPEVAQQFGIEGYPTIKLLKKSSQVEYNGDRTSNSFKEFVNENA